MKVLDINELKTLDKNVFVSIYMPTHRISSEAEQDPIRFKNLLREAEDKLDETSIKVGKEEFFKEANDLLENNDFWQNGLGSLLVVITDEETYVLDRPGIVDEGREVLFIGDKPYLVPLFDKNYLLEDYYILDVASDRFAFYTYDQDGLTEVELDNIKNKFDDLFDDKDNSDNDKNRTDGANTGFHGHHSASEVKERETEKYIRYISSEMSEYLKTIEDRDILLFGTTENVALFNEIAENDDIKIYYTFEKPLDSIDRSNLEDEVYGKLRDQYVANLRNHIENLNTNIANDLGSTDLTDIKKASEFAAIDTLYIDRDYDDIDTKEINDLVLDTLQKDGNVVLFDKEYNVWPGPIVAEYRFNPYGSNENN